MKIWHISDTHGFHDNLIIPEVDMVIFSGDESNDKIPALNFSQAIRFFDWFNQLPIKHKIYVPGNHSTAVQAGLVDPYRYRLIRTLIHAKCEIEGIRIFGSPYTPSYGNSWAYMKPRHKMEVVWNNIPETDILITHGMPKGILDLADDTNDRDNIVQAGCKSLYNKICEIKPKIYLGGHLHSTDRINNYGCFYHNQIYFFNGSCLNHKKQEINPGHIFDFVDNKVLIN